VQKKEPMLKGPYSGIGKKKTARKKRGVVGGKPALESTGGEVEKGSQKKENIKD